MEQPPKIDKGSAAHLYSVLEVERKVYLDRAIESAALTIPTLVPPHGHSSTTKYPTPYQSIGARGVNNLSSKLLLTLFPTNTPCFRSDIDQYTLERLGQDPAQKAAVDAKLAKRERAVQRKIETEAIRVSAFEGLKHLLVAGNAMLYLPKGGGMRVFTLRNFVIQRDPMDQVLDIVVKETVAPETLSAALREWLVAGTSKQPTAGRDKTLDLYTHVRFTGTNWEVYQEIKGQKVPGSTGTYPKDKSPWIPIRMNKIAGESYGRGFVEEYLGDLKSLEGLSQAIVEGAAAAAKILFLVSPNGTTHMEDLAKTESGGFANGNKDDVSVLQLEKYNDFRVALEASAKIEERLGFAFMLNSAVQRSGERVTAEEIRFMAQELESSLGGVYSVLSQELQLPLVTRLLFLMERAGELPTLPKGIVKPIIVTGLEALGRGNDLNKLDTFMSAVMNIPEAVSRVNWSDYMTRRATALGIDTEGLIKTDAQVLQEQQQAQMQAMIQQGIAPGVTALGGMAKQGMANGASNPQSNGA